MASFTELRIQHRKKSRSDEIFCTGGGMKVRAHFDWYLMALYHSARHLITAYFMHKEKKNFKKELICEHVREAPALRDVSNQFDRLRQLYDLGDDTVLKYDHNTRKEADKAFEAVKTTVEKLLPKP